jgi:hypothetical protein
MISHSFENKRDLPVKLAIAAWAFYTLVGPVSSTGSHRSADLRRHQEVEHSHDEVNTNSARRMTTTTTCLMVEVEHMPLMNKQGTLDTRRSQALALANTWRCVPVDPVTHERTEEFEISYAMEFLDVAMMPASGNNGGSITSGATVVAIVTSTDEIIVHSMHQEQGQGVVLVPKNAQLHMVPKGNTRRMTGTIYDGPVDDTDETTARANRRSRSLERKEGTRSILVLRVSDYSGNEPDKTADELSDDFFGNGVDTHNVVSQM